MAKNNAVQGLGRTDSSIALPLVSVVIPCLNRADYLVPTIESVLQQDYPNIDCLVVDGGSTDDTLDILRRYDGRIKWISEPDKGPPDAINKGWRICNGEILAWLNADDLWAPGAVNKAVSYLKKHPEIDVVYGDCGIIDQHGDLVKIVRVREWDLEYAVKYCDYIIYQAASFMRRSILQRVGWLYPKLCHDHELWLRISLAGGNLQHLRFHLADARDHQGNLGSRSDLVVPLKLDLTRGFFARPNLPPYLSGLRDRAMSNSYLRGIDYVLGDRLSWHQYWPRIFGLTWQAIWADPSNLLRILKRFSEAPLVVFFRTIRPYLPEWILRAILARKQRRQGNPSYGT